MKNCINCNASLQDDAAFCANCGAQQGAPQPQPAPQPVIDYSDHTNEFDAQDAKDNKIYALLVYLTGVIGIIIALLANRESKYLQFHIKQVVRVLVFQILVAIVTVVLCWTFVFPIIGALTIAALEVLLIIGLVNTIMGKSKEILLINKIKFI